MHDRIERARDGAFEKSGTGFKICLSAERSAARPNARTLN